MGYTGSERTTRRVVEAVKVQWRRETARSYKPWIPEPGLWLQFDYGDGPLVGGERSVLFVAWLAWSRVRLILPLRDKKLPTVIAALDWAFRQLGGVPTYVLTDNERTVMERHIARVPVRNPKMVSASIFYGCTITTCVPYDPESKGGAEAAVRIAKADVLPSETNLCPAYDDWEQLEAACSHAQDRFNSRVHAVTRRVPFEALEAERPLLHRLPSEPYTAAFGESRGVSWSQTVHYGGARYSVPKQWRDLRVWVRVDGADGQVVIVGDNGSGMVEIVRHPRQDPGGVSLIDAHYPDHPSGPLDRKPKPSNPAEQAFLAIGPGATQWLIEAGVIGARSIETTMADAVVLAEAIDAATVDRALGAAAVAGRFAPGDLASILDARPPEPVRRPNPDSSLQPGTDKWEGFGQ
jgi:transposase